MNLRRVGAQQRRVLEGRSCRKNFDAQQSSWASEENSLDCRKWLRTMRRAIRSRKFLKFCRTFSNLFYLVGLLFCFSQTFLN